MFLIIFISLFPIKKNQILLLSITDLPEDDKVLELDKMINLDPRELKTEATGEKIIRQLQEYLLSKVDTDERAVLPEDKIQRLLVGVSNFKSFISF